MSESERRRKYRYGRVLIETSRVLTSTLDDAVVFLSGAQLEMLRNVTQYLRRLETYVTEYNPGYYLAPTTADYDDILAIVADMEEQIMGNPNTLWGYKEPYRFSNAWNDATAGDHDFASTTITSGKVARIESVAYKNETSVLTRLTIHAYLAGQEYWLHPILDVLSPPAGVWQIVRPNLTLEAGDYIRFYMFGVTLHDVMQWQAEGYQMEVPT